MKKNTLSLFVVFFLLTAFLPPSVYSQEEGPLSPEKKEAAAPSQVTESEINNEIQAIQDRIKNYQAAENEKTAASLGVSLAQLKERSEKAQETLVFYTRQLLALKKTETLAGEKKSLEESVATGSAFQLPQLPPYSLKIYDEAIAQLDESVSSKETAQMSLALAQKMLKNTRQRLKDAEQHLREVKEESATKGNGSLAQQWKKSFYQTEIDLARAVLGYEELAKKNAETKLEIWGIKEDVARKRAANIRANLHFDAEDLEKQISHIEEKRSALQESSVVLLKKMQKIEAQLVKSQKKIELIKGEEKAAEAKAEIAALETWRQACQRGLEQSEGSQQLLNYQKDLWKQRYEVIKGDAGTEDLTTWQKAATSQQDRIQQALAVEQNQQANLQLQISQVEKQLAQNNLSWDMKSHLKDQLEALKLMAESTFRYLTTLTVANQMSSRFIDEVDEKLAKNILKEKIASLKANIIAIWKFELMVADEQSITVGKVGIALFLLVFGIILSGHFARAIERHLLARTKLSESASAITEKLLYYLALCAVVLLSMRVVNIPLTAFAFLGGALAIGVGFGGQKIISNFISGFILMAEQPVKVGDLIQMGDLVGKIEEIGARSTRVRTFANIHVLVPNSYFLENNITNWTHSDKIIRAEVTTGVVYGSPTKEVKRLLMLAVSGHKETMEHPKPYVFFNDFGDNSLVFTVYFWITVQLINDKKRIESDVRFVIDDMFRKAGIVIAFPQRDVHLDTTRPLQFEMVDSKGATKSAEGSVPNEEG